MGRSRMTKFTTIAIVVTVCSIPLSSGIDPQKSIEGEAVAPGGRNIIGIADAAIRGIFRAISLGTSSEKDDEQLARLTEEEIVRTVQGTKKPSGSIEAAAKRAQRLVTELTTAYTTAIYKSKSTEEARVNFGRFQNTVKKIVDFIKNGRFVV